MSSEKTTSSDADNPAELWQEIDALVREVSTLARSGCSANQFYSHLLDATVRAMAAVGGAIWTLNDAGQLDLQSQLGWHETGLAEDDSAREQHGRTLEEILLQKSAVLLPPHSSDEQSLNNPTSCLLLVHPVLVDEKLFGLIEIFQRPDRSVTAQEGYCHFLQTMVELAGDYHRHSELKQLRHRSNGWLQYEQFTEQVHQNLHLKKTAFRLVNEGQRLIGCDRVSLLQRKGKQYRLIAVSGLEKVDRRSAVARLLERLTPIVVVTREPLLFSGETVDLPPQVEKPLQEYLELSKSRVLLIQPLPKIEETTKENETTGKTHQQNQRPPVAEFAVVVEKFDAKNIDDSFHAAMDSVVRQGRLALYNALAHHNLPMRWVMKWVGKATWFLRGSRFPKTMTCLLLSALAICALFFIPADFHVTGKGELQPKEQHHLFAGAMGVVSNIRVKHGQQISKNDLLLELTSTELAYDRAQIEGERQTVNAQLDVLQVTLRAGVPSTAEEQLKYNRAIAEQEELKVRQKSLQKQLAILREQEKSLQIRSPINGEVLTWDVAQSLQARPVNRGQKLLTIANPKGVWLLEIKIPDRQIHYLQELFEQHRSRPDKKIKLTFILATEPDVTYTLEKNVEDFHLSTATETDHTGEAIVRLTVEVDQSLIPPEALRPGATILPRLHCGKRSIGFVWFHDIIHAVKTKILF